MRRRATSLLACVAFAGAAPMPLGAQTAHDQLVARYEKAKKEELIASGQRHVDLGWAIRKTGLQQQATWQFVRAVEVSEGTHGGANMVLGIVRAYGDAFWKKARKKPTRAALSGYRKRAEAIERDDRKGQVKLAKAAEKARLDDRAREHWLGALRLGAELVITDKGAKIDGEKVSDETVAWLEGQTLKIDGVRAFDPGASKTPQLENVSEVRSDDLVVRTDLGAKTAAALHALGTALRAPLEARLDGVPVQALRLFVFARRADYDAYLAGLGHADAAGRGLCDYGTYQTLVCAEGLDEHDLQAIVLHELTHLYFFGCSPVAMPDWYAEGLAETFGGQGTFVWDGKALTTGGPMREDRVAAVKAAPIPLRELFPGDAMALLQADHERALRWYAQCQLLQRFLVTEDCPWRARFEWWEDECRGTLAGSSSTRRLGDTAPAKAAFERLFGEDLDALEQAFRAWLEQQ